MTRTDRQDRLLSALGAGVVQVAVGWLLLSGLVVHLTAPDAPAIAVFDAAPPPPEPPPPPQPDPIRSPRSEGAAAPPNLRANATPVVAPPPLIILPSPLIAAPIAFRGFEANQGAAERPGPGTGAGGEGDGTGSGRFGDGGGAGGAETPPRWRSGRIRNSDYPEGVDGFAPEGTVEVRYLVETNGRVTACDVVTSSGSPLLDETTCRLILRRFRYAPSRDEAGRPVPAMIVESHSWEVERVAADPS